MQISCTATKHSHRLHETGWRHPTSICGVPQAAETIDKNAKRPNTSYALSKIVICTRADPTPHLRLSLRIRQDPALCDAVSSQSSPIHY